MESPNSNVFRSKYASLRRMFSSSKCGPKVYVFKGLGVLAAGGLGITLGYEGLARYKSLVVHAEAELSREPKLNIYEDGDGKTRRTSDLIATGNQSDGKEAPKSPKALVVEPNEGLDLKENGKQSLGSNDENFDWAQLGEIVSPYWKRLLIAVGSAFAVALINIEIPSTLGKLVDAVTDQLMLMRTSMSEEMSTEFLASLKAPAMKLILLYIAQAIGTFSSIYNLSVIGEGMALELRTRLFASLLNQEVSFFDSHMTGDVASRLTADIQEFKSSFKQCLSQGLRSVSQTLGCVISLFFVSKEMTLTVVAVVPAIILLGTIFTRGLRKLSRRSQNQLSEASGNAEEALSNIRTVKTFAMEEQELLKYRIAIKELQRLNIDLGAGIGLFQGGSNLFLNGIVLGVMYTGGKLIAAQKLSSGDLMAFLVASQTIQRSLANMSLLFGQYVRGIGAGTRVFSYINLDTPELKASRAQGDILDTLQGEIEFKNVSFSYPTRPNTLVLKEFTLKLPKGKMVAVVGASGSGKSTLVNILEGFYPLLEGSVTIDEHPIDKLNTKWLRKDAIGLINQEPILFATSIMENIRYGKPSASDDDVIEAAKRANAYEFVMDFPEGFHTKVGERGVTVSGGQRQRIAIARALIKQPKILVLDEATSALDADSEQIVQKALDSAVQGRTVLVIAHRLSTIKKADVIAVMSHGSIVEMGTHDNLMQKKGFYYGLVKQQEFLTKPT
ncbi:ATP-binding cassette sub-family B member 8, mitochondrial [Orchesella cincta]|uniref:Mitochondrial potassium channel ATP-binding subunit n=1 Tax=Orchesella cincta TaxID=48709 RepID=A0A1D2MK38_ORCCI|nr:ATP-binding cassette sub-family B member 8, mitochondrial [Orchesella cincta]